MRIKHEGLPTVPGLQKVLLSVLDLKLTMKKGRPTEDLAQVCPVKEHQLWDLNTDPFCYRASTLRKHFTFQLTL